MVPFGREAGKRLWRYLKQRAQKTECEALWITRSGRQMRYKGVLKCFERAGINPHRLRHSFALAFLDNGGDPFALQRMLGHSRLEMTRRYVNQSSREIRRQHDQHSPGDKLWHET